MGTNVSKYSPKPYPSHTCPRPTYPYLTYPDPQLTSDAMCEAVMMFPSGPSVGVSALGSAPTTIVWATTAMKPSMWTPRSILVDGSAGRRVSGIDGLGCRRVDVLAGRCIGGSGQ